MNKHQLQDALERSEFSSSSKMIVSPEGAVSGFGTTVGNGVQGWAPGATFTHTDGTEDITASTMEYINVGTVTAASWVAKTDPKLGFRRWADASLFQDDFNGQYAGTYTVTSDGSTGAAAVDADAVWGIMSVATEAVDNDYHYLTTPQPVADINASYEFIYEARVKLTEAATNAANWWCGLITNDDIASDIIGDDGAGPATSFDGAYFYKVDGTMQIMFEASRAGTRYADQSMGTFTSNTWYRLGIVWNGTTMTPYLDGVAGTGGTGTNSDAAMFAGFGVKAGGGNAETILVDYHKCMMWPTSGSR